MRVALYHHLRAGGALRVVRDFVAHANGRHEYTVFTVATSEADVDDLNHRPAAEVVVRASGWMARVPRGVVGEVAVLDRLEREVADRINGGGFDATFVHPCSVTQSPLLLLHLTVPSLYYMEEPRRQSTEAGYRPPPQPGYSAMRAARRLGGLGWEQYLRARDRRAVAAAATLVANSHFTAEAVLRQYGRPAAVCLPGVDVERFRPADEPTGVAREAFVLAVGALDHLKGHDLAVEALGLLPHDRRVALHVVYERESERFKEGFLRLAAERGVEVRLRRGVSDRDLIRLYQDAVAVLALSRLEPLGLTPMEAIACGTPVVALAEGGFRETVVDGVTGLLVPRRPAALADAIDRVRAGELPGPEVIRSVALERWRWDRAVECVEAELERTVNADGRSLG